MEAPKQLFIETLTPEEISIIEKRLKPQNEYSNADYLCGTQSLRKVIEQDARTLKKKRITHAQIGDMLESLVNGALIQLKAADADASAYAEGILVQGKFKVSCDLRLGIEYCSFFYKEIPIREKIKGRWKNRGYNVISCGIASSYFTILNEKQGTKINFYQLMPHLIRDHHFFGGSGAMHRLSPEKAIRVLELNPQIDYSKKQEK
jgi:hypothetical protein